MKIPVRCPKCQTTYELNPETIGQRVRCPNTVCREIFVAAPAEDRKPDRPAREDEPSPPEVRHQAGNVGDIIPMLPVENATQEPLPEPEPAPKRASGKDTMIPMLPVEAAEAPAAASWQQPPPVRRAAPPATEPPATPDWRSAPPPSKRQPAPATAQPSAEAQTPPKKATPPVRKKAPETVKLPPPKPVEADPKKTMTALPAVEAPKEVTADDWQAPPIRRDAQAVQETTEAAPAVATDTATEFEIAPASHKVRNFLLISPILVGLALWGGWLIIKGSLTDQGDRDFAEAMQLYKAGRFKSAAEKFEKLATEGSNTDERPNYRKYANLSSALDAVNQINADSPKAFDLLRDFCDAHDDDAILKEQENRENIAKGFLTSAERITEQASQAQTAGLLVTAGEALKLSARFNEGSIDENLKTARARIAEVDLAIGNKQRFDEALAAITKEANSPTFQSLGKVNEIFQRLRVHWPDLDKDPKVVAQVARIAEALRRMVKFKPAGGNLPPPRIEEETEPSLLIVPATFTPAAALNENPRIVFALARGVLYALEHSTGRVQWATRVGIDTTALPLRLPATEISNEIVLVLSSDTNTLTARDARTGQPYWHHQLSAPCLGKPVIVDKRVYVPTYDGKVSVIEVIEGKLIGEYLLGQALTVGGVHQEGTDFLYFPAEHRSVFVINKEDRENPCVHILQTGHPAGSLRSEPIIISRELLRKVHQLDPAVWPDYLILSQAEGLDSTKMRVFALPITSSTSPPLLANEPQVKGWSWFPPFHDPERIVQVTDAGVLGLIGIKQVKNQDPDLFLESRNEIALLPQVSQLGRAQIVHVVEDDLWVLAKGEMQLLHFDRLGQRVSPLWQAPLPLGSPLHSSQVVDGKLLVVVTQLLQRPGCLASAIDGSLESESGVIRWQRQLGFVAQGESLQLGPELVSLDEGGSLFLFDARKQPQRSDYEWQQGGQILDVNPVEVTGTTYLLAGRGGKTAFAVGTAKGNRISVRRYESGRPLTGTMLNGLAPLAGTPAVGDDGFVFPLTDGKLVFAPFDESKRHVAGPEWRARAADKQAPGHVVYLGNGEFLYTNGLRGLTRIRWAGGPLWETMTTGDLEDRIALAPLVLRRANAGDDLQLIVADARGQLMLVQERSVNRNRNWNVARTWALKGRITSGPFLRGNHIGCIVDQQRLIWIDPNGATPVWQYQRQDDQLVGPPQIIGDLLVVAHRSGRFVGLDPATGKPVGPGYQLRAASVAPAATPVAFGAGRAFAPLTDGTVLLLSLKQVQHPLVGFPRGF